MTKEQAIRILDADTSVEAVEELKYYAGFNKDKVIDMIQEAMDMGAEALKKQIPKEPIPIITDDNEYICTICPTCQKRNVEGFNYCPICGQAIDWGETDDR